MVQIDMEMPGSCSECPFNQNNICPIMPSVPAWQKEIEQCKDRRAKHCPLINYEKDDIKETIDYLDWYFEADDGTADKVAQKAWYIIKNELTI